MDAIIKWIQSFPLGQVPAMFWTLFWVTLLILVIAVVRKVATPSVLMLALAFVLVVGTEHWRQTAGVWDVFATTLFYIASIAVIILMFPAGFSALRGR